MKFFPKKRVKVKAVLQFEQTECGAASLSSILKYYGKCVKLSEVRRECNVNRDGSTLKDIFNAAIKYKLETKFIQWNVEQLIENSTFPLIIFWQNNHFIVLESIDNNYAYIADPAQGNIRVTAQEFKDSYSNAGLYLTPSKNFIKSAADNSSLRLLLNQFYEYKFSFMNVIIASTILGMITVISAGLTSVFINKVLQDQNINLAIPIIWLLLLFTIVSLTTSLIEKLINRRVEFLLSKKIAYQLFTFLFKKDYYFHSSRSSGELASRMIIGMTLTQSSMSVILRFLMSLWTGIIVLIFSLILSKWLAVIALSVIIINTSANWLLTSLRYESNRKLALTEGNVQGKAIYSVSNIESIKAAGIEYEMLDKWQEAFNELVTQNQLLGKQLSLTTVLSTSSQFLLSFLLIFAGGFLIISGETSIGTLIAFQFILPNISAPISLFPSVSKTIQNLIGDLARIEDIESADDDPLVQSLNASSKDTYLNLENISGSIQVKNLDFGYKAGTAPTIKNLNLSINSGSYVSIVGKSGSGKTTLIKLLSGFYTPWSGKILFDQLEWKPDTALHLHSQIAYVSQQVFVFNASVVDNITLYQSGYLQNDIEQAVENALLKEVILNHPDGYKRHLKDNGRDLSGGERQRLEIARALLRKPSIILLDEATSALDNQTQTKLIKTLKKFNKTIISIAHRIDIASSSDKVIVMEDGLIVEEGKPEDLLKQKSYFYSLLHAENL